MIGMTKGFLSDMAIPKIIHEHPQKRFDKVFNSTKENCFHDSIPENNSLYPKARGSPSQSTDGTLELLELSTQ
jgi:hypothetical protein